MANTPATFDAYPYNAPVSFHFRVKIYGYDSDSNDLRFQDVGGLTAEINIEELVSGGENTVSYRLPTRVKYGNLVLKRGMLKDSKLIEWFRNAIEEFEFAPANVEVSLLNENNQAVTHWIFTQAYPVKWVIADFSATGNTLVVETIELAYQYFQRKTS
ncbi:MAG: phage tail protein [Ferruginibacter sp.]